MIVKKHKLISWMAIILLVPVLIYPMMSSSLMLSISELLCWGFGFALLFSKKSLSIKKNIYLLMWLLTLLPITINSTMFRMNQYGYFLMWISALLIMFMDDQYTTVEFRNVVLFIGVICSIYVLSTIIFNIMPNNGIMLRIASLFRQTIQKGSIKTAGLTSHYSHNAMYIALASMVWFSFVMNLKGRKKHISLIMLILSVIAMLLTQKRGPLVALVISFILSRFINQQGNITKRIQRLLITAIVLLFMLYLGYELFPSLFSVIDRFSQTDNVLSNRLYLWQYAWDLFLRKPIVGYGWGYYSSNINIIINTMNVSSIYAHNIYLQLLAETGIIGTVIFLSAMILTLRKSIALSRNTFVNSKDNISITFSVCMQIFFLIYGISGNPLYDKQMCLPYLTAVAITLVYIHKGCKNERIL